MSPIATAILLTVFAGQSAVAQVAPATAAPAETSTLDELSQRYVRTPVGGAPSETFITARGPISFGPSDIRSAHIPSTKQLAFIRIGKKASTENAELIKAWLDEAARSKQGAGYKLLTKATRKTDYGEATEAEYRKGDLYFKTWFQYERILESYRRHSLQYTYHVEVGSLTRRSQYLSEQYRQKLGN